MSHRSAFDAMFAPRAIAVVGATDREGSVGRTVVENLKRAPFSGNLFAVNPKREKVLGFPCYGSILDLTGKVDLALIITPAPTVPEIVGECVKAGLQAAVVISAGFRERGEVGANLERHIREQLKGSRMRLIGPNCLGIMNPVSGLNATFAHDLALPGSVAFLSQSGALETAILDWSLAQKVGFSAIVSTGSMLDVGWGDLIDYFGEDDQTRSILLYMESVGDARAFLSAAREVALRKPIIVIKAGRSDAAARAATSHTGALTGSDTVFDAAIRRCGILRVQNISDLFHMAETLDRQPRPQGPRLTILTNAGGPGVLATDALIANGGELAALSAASLQRLSEFLSPNWSHANPIDVLGDSGPDAYAGALEIAINDPNSDGLLAILAPQGMTDPDKVAERLTPFAKSTGKPLLASWMGGNLVAKGTVRLNQAGIATFSYPDTAARAFCYMWRNTYNLRAIYETPEFAEEIKEGDDSGEAVQKLLNVARRAGRTLLSEYESKQILMRYGIPVVDTRIAHSVDEAAAAAEAIGFPVVLKVHSERIAHKTDAGGVRLYLRDERAVREAFREIEVAVSERAGDGTFQGVSVQPMVSLDGYELILGSSVDPQFGPVILFGTGGTLVEVYDDHALALPPLNATLARRLMEHTHIFAALKGIRGRPSVNIGMLERILVRFSKLLVEQAAIKEIDVNPLMVSGDQIVALDARVVLFPSDAPADQMTKPAIRPYPSKYVRGWTTKSGLRVLIRPIRPEDERLLVKFHAGLSNTSVYLRYFHMMSLDARVAHARLMRQCFIDYDREMALVAEYRDPQSGEGEIWAVGRLTQAHNSREAEVSVLVTDSHQKEGLGTELVGRLIDFGRDEKLERIVANILPENSGMNSLGRHYNFHSVPSPDPGTITVALDL
ncbi:MAG TPA: bifunctional acetate--CoA ligase family protein/GNAT family N-acetyltransferase [Candidatus Acidoferrum sp.]|nr:bifunctional acetate--CoA ligase family protein/GNAT family N-acetyltransferase [Candidatus Acidoferrum sp.]